MVEWQRRPSLDFDQAVDGELSPVLVLDRHEHAVDSGREFVRLS